MKTIVLIIRQTEISKLFPKGLQLMLADDAWTIDAIRAFYDEMKEKFGKFPVKGFDSILQMVYHPYEEKFYKQVAVQAYVKSRQTLNIIENPRMPLPNETTMILIREGGCATDWEEPVK